MAEQSKGTDRTFRHLLANTLLTGVTSTFLSPGQYVPITAETIGWKKLSLARCREMSPIITSGKPRISEH